MYEVDPSLTRKQQNEEGNKALDAALLARSIEQYGIDNVDLHPSNRMSNREHSYDSNDDGAAISIEWGVGMGIMGIITYFIPGGHENSTKLGYMSVGAVAYGAISSIIKSINLPFGSRRRQ